MPFELGLDYGCRVFGDKQFFEKESLILEENRYELPRSLSDLAGVDVKAHDRDPEELIHQVRKWIRGFNKEVKSGTKLWREYLIFAGYFKEIMKEQGFKKKDIDEMEPPEYIDFITDWMEGQKDLHK